MMIFPLGTGGKIALILVAIFIIMIWSMLWRPGIWVKLLRKAEAKAREKDEERRARKEKDEWRRT